MRILKVLLAISAIGCVCSGEAAEAGTHEKVLYRFDGYTGVSPSAVLVPDKNGNFYSTTYLGGAANSGTVFKLSPRRILSVLYSFGGLPDGSEPIAAPVRDSNGNLYGTTYGGGDNDLGTVFKIDSDGSETILHSFTGCSDGEWPTGGLVMGKLSTPERLCSGWPE
jgi:uncharacterized repeat protein (TIGR03803 family)